MSGNVTMLVPVVRSTRHRASSRLCACTGMAVAYARGDQHGDRYRDLLELCLRDHPVSVDTVIAMARRLFPDVPVSDYGPDEIEVDDAVTLACLATERGGRVLPVLFYDPGFQPDIEVSHLHAIVLGTFHPGDPTKRSFWDAEPVEIGGWRMGSRVSDAPPGFRCVVFGWLPPARAAAITRAGAPGA
ncbi:MAG: hypothetical protein F9K40_09160 [Kofleriaceae bacterium]|nr:MAG: hypothetical protein F9K40_09160 [Kofleriaceae bacterium]MBZ0230733.1 hypothetical protein [Kofleriaceae bacterium]